MKLSSLKFKNLNQQGFSLIEIMVAAGVLGIVTLGFITMMENQSKQVKYLETKQDLINIRNFLLRSISDNTSCCPFANTTIGDLTFSASTPPSSVTFSNFFRSCAGSTPPLLLALGGANPDLPSLNVQSMAIENFSGIDNNYSGDVVIKMTNKNSGFIEPKPIKLAFNFKTQDSAPGTKQIVSCNAGKATKNKLSLTCVDVKNQCTVGTGSASCDSPNIPADYVMTGGSCISGSDNGAGRLLTNSAPSGNRWSCRSKDHDTLSSGVLIATARACALSDPSLPPPTLDCQTVTNSCATSPNSMGNCSSGIAPTGYSLVGGGCTSAAISSIGRLLIASYPNSSSTAWTCQDKDHATSVGGNLIAHGIFCKIATGIVGNLNCKTISNSIPAVSDNSLYISVDAPTGFALTSVGCNTINASPGRLLTSLGMASAPAQSVTCSNKDHDTGAGGVSTVYAIGCEF